MGTSEAAAQAADRRSGTWGTTARVVVGTLRRDDEVGCAPFWAIDRVETRRSDDG